MQILMFALLLVSLVGCVKSKGDHGTMTQVELELKNGGTIILVCPEFDRVPLGIHGRECYIKKQINKT